MTNLENLLRRRGTPLCLIAADFVQDHPEDEAVVKARKYLDKRLSSFFPSTIEFALSDVTGLRYLSMSAGPLADTAIRAFSQLNNDKEKLIYEAIQGKATDPSWCDYPELHQKAVERIDAMISVYSQGWTSRILRILRPNAGKK